MVVSSKNNTDTENKKIANRVPVMAIRNTIVVLTDFLFQMYIDVTWKLKLWRLNLNFINSKPLIMMYSEAQNRKSWK